MSDNTWKPPASEMTDEEVGQEQWAPPASEMTDEEAPFGGAPSASGASAPSGSPSPLRGIRGGAGGAASAGLPRPPAQPGEKPTEKAEDKIEVARKDLLAQARLNQISSEMKELNEKYDSGVLGWLQTRRVEDRALELVRERDSIQTNDLQASLNVLASDAVDRAGDSLLESTPGTDEMRVSADAAHDVARQVLKSMGVDDQDLYMSMVDKVKSAAVDKHLAPRTSEAIDDAVEPIRQKWTEAMNEFVGTDKAAAKFTGKVADLQTEFGKKIEAEAAGISKELKDKVAVANAGWEVTQKALQQEGAQLDADYKAGKLDAEQYNLEVDRLNKRGEAYYSQYQAQHERYLSEYQERVKPIALKYQSQFEQQQRVLANSLNDQLKAKAKEFEELNSSAMKAEIKDAASGAVKGVYDKYAKELESAAERANLGEIWTYGGAGAAMINFAAGFRASLGNWLKGSAVSMGSDALYEWGDEMANASNLVHKPISGLADWVNPAKAGQAIGDLAGYMAPGMLASGVVATASGGVGAPAAMTLVASGLAGWASESQSMAGSAYERAILDGKSKEQAEKAAAKTWETQTVLLPAYAFEGLPFMGKALKAIGPRVGRMVAGGGIEMATETLQEIPQGIFEARIAAGLDPYAGFFETLDKQLDDGTIRDTMWALSPTLILGGGGQLNSSSARQEMERMVKAASTSAAVATEVKAAPAQWMSSVIDASSEAMARASISMMHQSGFLSDSELAEYSGMLDSVIKSRQHARDMGLSGERRDAYVALSAERDAMLARADQLDASRGSERELGGEFMRKAAEKLDEKISAIATGDARKSNYIVVRHPNGKRTIMTPEQLSRASGNAKFIASFVAAGKGERGVSIDAVGGEADQALTAFTEKMNAVMESQEAMAEIAKAAAGGVRGARAAGQKVPTLTEASEIAARTGGEQELADRASAMGETLRKLSKDEETGSEQAVPAEGEVQPQAEGTKEAGQVEQAQEGREEVVQTEPVAESEPDATSVVSSEAEVSDEQIQAEARAVERETQDFEAMASEQEDGTEAGTRRAAAIRQAERVQKALGGKVKFQFLSEQEMQDELDALGQDVDAGSTPGFLNKDDGTIAINLDAVGRGGTREGAVVYHEGTHIIADAIAEARPELMAKMAEQVRGLAGSVKGVQELVDEMNEGAYGDGALNDLETVVEFAARVSSGAIDINDKTTLQKVRDALAAIAKALGMKPPGNSAEEVMEFAEDMAAVFRGEARADEVAKASGGAIPGATRLSTYKRGPMKPDEIADPDTQRDHLRVGTSFISGAKMVPLDQESNITMDRIPDRLRKRYADAFFTSPEYSALPFDARAIRNTEKRLEFVKDFMRENISGVFFAFPAEHRARATHWYDGALRMAMDLADAYGVKVEQVAAVMAILSPQTHWYINMAMAEMVINLWAQSKSTVIKASDFGHGIEEYVRPSASPAEARKRRLAAAQLEGMSFEEIIATGSTPAIMTAVRVMAHEKWDNRVPVVLPEGEIGGVSDISMRWQGGGPIAKAISVLEDGSLENISIQLGTKHKVRSFYNNIVAPRSPYGDFTSDTHQANVSLLLPMGGSYAIVGDMLGGGAQGKPFVGAAPGQGVAGTYPIFADAHREVAAELNLLPRQVQSITWEGIRLLNWKKSARGFMEIQQIWKNNSIDEARKIILEKGLATPDWAEVKPGSFARPAGAGVVILSGAEGISVPGREVGERQGGAGRVVLSTSKREADGSLRGLPREKGKHSEHSRHWGVAEQVASNYMAAAGLKYNRPDEFIPTDIGLATAIADEYDKAIHRPNDKAVAESYEAFIQETVAQYKAIVEQTGLKVEFMEKGKDPYAESLWLLHDDVKNNNHMWVFPTEVGFGQGRSDTSAHPLLRETDVVISGKRATANDLFRAVHDYFAHIKEGLNFDLDGEDNAWRSHAAMYSEKALPAMTAETRGQNAWVNYGPYGEHNRSKEPGANVIVGDVVFADQKATIMPPWTYDPDQRVAPSEKPVVRLSTTAASRDLGWFQRRVDALSKDAMRFKSGPSKASINRLLSSGKWAMLTGENPGAKPADEKSNAFNNESLKAWLTGAGYAPIEIVGKYGSYENSFLVPKLTMADAVHLVNAFSQESVATDEGLVYADGTMNPRKRDADNLDVQVSPDSDFFSVIPTTDGPLGVAVAYDFEQRVAPQNATIPAALDEAGATPEKAASASARDRDGAIPAESDGRYQKLFDRGPFYVNKTKFRPVSSEFRKKSDRRQGTTTFEFNGSDGTLYHISYDNVSQTARVTTYEERGNEIIADLAGQLTIQSQGGTLTLGPGGASMGAASTFEAYKIAVTPGHRFNGVARAMYEFIDELGIPLNKSSVIQPAAAHFWDNRKRTGVRLSTGPKRAREGVNLVPDSWAMNMDTSPSGEYLFYHVGPGKLKGGVVDPSMFGKNVYTSDRRRNPISMFYTRSIDGESMVIGEPHVISVPPHKVYPFQEDPLDFYPEAEKMFRKENGDMAFDPNAQLDYIGDLAHKAGFDIIVAKWGSAGKNPLRAESQKPLKPNRELTDAYRRFGSLDPKDVIPGLEREIVGAIAEKASTQVALKNGLNEKFYSESFKPSDVLTDDQLAAAAGKKLVGEYRDAKAGVRLSTRPPRPSTVQKRRMTAEQALDLLGTKVWTERLQEDIVEAAEVWLGTQRDAWSKERLDPVRAEEEADTLLKIGHVTQDAHTYMMGLVHDLYLDQAAASKSLSDKRDFEQRAARVVNAMAERALEAGRANAILHKVYQNSPHYWARIEVQKLKRQQEESLKGEVGPNGETGTEYVKRLREAFTEALKENERLAQALEALRELNGMIDELNARRAMESGSEPAGRIDLDQLLGEKAGLEERISELEDLVQRQQEELQALEDRIADIIEKQAERKGKMADEIAELKKQRRELKAKLERQANAIEQLKGLLQLERSERKQLEKDLKKLRQEFDRFINEILPTYKGRPVDRSTAERIIAAALQGKMGDPDFVSAMAERLGTSELTDGDIAVIELIARGVQMMQVSGNRALQRQYITKLNTLIANKRISKDTGDFLMGMVYIHALSGANTLFNATYGAALEGYTQTFVNILRRLARGEFGAVAFGIKQSFASKSSWAAAAAKALRDTNHYDDMAGYMEARSNMEVGGYEQFLRESIGAAMKKHFGGSLENLKRGKLTASAADFAKGMWFIVGQSMKVAFMIRAIDAFATHQIGDMLKAADFFAENAKDMSGSSSIVVNPLAGLSGAAMRKIENAYRSGYTVQTATARAEKELRLLKAAGISVEDINAGGLANWLFGRTKKSTGRTVKEDLWIAQRVREIMESGMESDFVHERNERAREFILMGGHPDGIMGWGHDKLKKIVYGKRDPDLAQFFLGATFMFTRIMANTWNKIHLNLPIVGMIPTVYGMYRRDDGSWGIGLDKFKSDPEKAYQRIASNMMVTAVMAGVMASMFDFEIDDEDDEDDQYVRFGRVKVKLDPDRLIDFSSSAYTMDYQANKDIDEGYKNFSVRFRQSPEQPWSKYYSFRLWPTMAALPAFLGRLSDDIKMYAPATESANPKAVADFKDVGAEDVAKRYMTQPILIQMESSFNSIARAVKAGQYATNEGGGVPETIMAVMSSPIQTLAQPSSVRDIMDAAAMLNGEPRTQPEKAGGSLKVAIKNQAARMWGLDRLLLDERTDRWGIPIERTSKLSDWLEVDPLYTLVEKRKEKHPEVALEFKYEGMSKPPENYRPSSIAIVDGGFDDVSPEQAGAIKDVQKQINSERSASFNLAENKIFLDANQKEVFNDMYKAFNRTLTLRVYPQLNEMDKPMLEYTMKEIAKLSRKFTTQVMRQAVISDDYTQVEQIMNLARARSQEMSESLRNP